MAEQTTSMSTNDVMARAESALSDDAMEEMGASEQEAPVDDGPDIDVEVESDEPEADGPGSRSSPYTVKTLPDAHVTLKIDGEDTVVPLRDMVDGYMRQDVFHRRLNQVAQLKDKAEQTVKSYKEEEAKFKDAFTGLIRDPDNLFNFLDEHSPEVLDAVARKMLKRAIAERDNPQARMEREYAKRQEKLERERRELQEERDSANRSRHEQAQHAKYLGEFKPGFDAGMKAAGYPEITDDFRETVKGIIAARRQKNGKVTSKDVEDAVVRTARALGSPTVASRKPAPPPVRQQPQAAPRQSKQQSKPSGSKSFSQLFRDLGK